MSVAVVIDAPAGRQKRVLPGFGLTMGLTLTYVGIIVLLTLLGQAVDGVVMPRIFRWLRSGLIFANRVGASRVQLLDEFAVGL